MDLRTRVKRLEETIGKNRLSENERLLVIFDEKEDAEQKIESRLQELRGKYGDDISRDNLFLIRVCYEKNNVSTRAEQETVKKSV
jgi:allophanate hydrolase subunit 1